MPDSDDWSHAEIVRSLKRIEGSVGELKTEVTGLTAGFLPRSEWQIWATARDREIADLKAARAPWWTWVTVAVAVLTVLVTLMRIIPDIP